MSKKRSRRSRNRRIERQNEINNLHKEKVDEYYYDIICQGREVKVYRTPELSEGCDEYSMEKVIRHWLEDGLEDGGYESYGGDKGVPTIEILEGHDYKNGNQSIVLIDPKLVDTDREDGSFGYPDDIHEYITDQKENGNGVLIFVIIGLHEVVKTWKKTYQELSYEFMTEYDRLRESREELGKEKYYVLISRLYEKYEPYMEVWEQELKKVS